MNHEKIEPEKEDIPIVNTEKYASITSIRFQVRFTSCIIKNIRSGGIQLKICGNSKEVCIHIPENCEYVIEKFYHNNGILSLKIEGLRIIQVDEIIKSIKELIA